MLTKLFAVVFATAGLTVAAMGVAPDKSADCCRKNLKCCEATRACCTDDAKPKCCAAGKECCEKNLACCDSPPQCCIEGRECCDQGLPCCDEVEGASLKSCCRAPAQSSDDE